jgi:hypothetical protein
MPRGNKPWYLGVGVMTERDIEERNEEKERKPEKRRARGTRRRERGEEKLGWSATHS